MNNPLSSDKYYIILCNNFSVVMAIQVTYRRTSRLSMRIVKNGDVHVSAPYGLPKTEVESFI